MRNSATELADATARGIQILGLCRFSVPSHLGFRAGPLTKTLPADLARHLRSRCAIDPEAQNALTRAADRLAQA